MRLAARPQADPTQGTRPPQGKHTNTPAVSLHVYSAQRHMLATHTVVWTLLSHPYRTKEQEVQVEEDAEEHDGEDDEDGEDNEEDEEDKGDGGTHATVVADLHETMKPQGERKALEKDKTRRTRRRRRRRRRRQLRRHEEETDAEYLPATGKSEINETLTEDEPGREGEDQEADGQ